ncbi:purine permease protein Cpx [Gottschalkia acidurici 9a]|uniref:Purine permease protein Cpx n=1 Tax=Gottschalkia acidurici (strain ATCC 7906 / DSM 604 / BCRC 14475 / CIP 104303 / KCTC 5404 / NCIMB 10678 / 9a) TaxID=1128398 RepID=K0B3T7_GOTA9|nr:nucleobase:cation symporter-2 family protein [Gottschalkia acidurici]AFS79802.1 purine permease protein Cpx [Gottschalkia acidurici 9a]
MSNEAQKSTNLLYGVDDRPGLPIAILLAFQNIITSFGGIVAVPLILGQALGFPVEEVAFLVSATVFVSGITTWIQAKGIGPIGAKAPCVMGTDITFVAPALTVGVNMGLGLPGIMGASIMGASIEMILSRFLKPLMKFFPPVVTGTVVTLIGTSLIPVSIDWMAGGAGSKDYGNPLNIIVALTVLTVIIFLNRYGKGMLGSASVLIGIVLGYIISTPLGLIDYQAIADAQWFSLPTIFKYGVTFDFGAFISFAPAYLVATIGTVGVLLAVSGVIDKPLSEKQIADGVLCDGFGSFIAGFFGAGPNTSFSQNVGLIPLTRVASRYVVTISGVILVLLGIFPKFSTLIAIMPNPVLGGAGIVMFGIVAASGIKALGEIKLDNRNLLIIAVSLGLGLGITVKPELLSKLPKLAQMIFSSGISTGTIVALALNVLLKEEKDDEITAESV